MKVINPWIPEIIEELKVLKKNWDSDVNPALRYLGTLGKMPKPHVYPTRDGGVQFDWEVFLTVYLEVSVKSGRVSYLYGNGNIVREGYVNFP